MSQELSNQHLEDWNERLMLAESALPIIGGLFRNQGVVLLMFGHPLFERTPIDILREHRWVRRVGEGELSIRDSYPLIEALGKMELRPCRVDIGELVVDWVRAGRSPAPAEYLEDRLRGLESIPERIIEKPQDVVLYGFGRIGRLIARLLIERTGKGEALRLRAIVVRQGSKDDLWKRANLLRRDSIHGRFEGTITVDEENNAFLLEEGLCP